jgi:hypothetical protein
MAVQQPQPKRTVLTDDGELREISDLPEAQTATAYCINCGAANRMSARFCRSCGESLDEQIPNDTHAYGLPGQKPKRTLQYVPQPAPARLTFWSVALELITLLFVAIMVGTTAHTGSAIPVVIVIAWVIVEVARHAGGGRRP